MLKATKTTPDCLVPSLVKQFEFLTQGLSGRARFNTTRISYFDVIRRYAPFYYQLGGYNAKASTYQVKYD